MVHPGIQRSSPFLAIKEILEKDQDTEFVEGSFFQFGSGEQLELAHPK